MDDALGRVVRYRDLEDCKGTIRWFSVSETMTNRTMYLWGLYSLNRVHLLVAQAIELAKTTPGLRCMACWETPSCSRLFRW
jgi:hypothetical protein